MRRHGTLSRLGFWRACLFPLREPSLSQACHWSAPEYPATLWGSPALTLRLQVHLASRALGGGEESRTSQVLVPWVAYCDVGPPRRTGTRVPPSNAYSLVHSRAVSIRVFTCTAHRPADARTQTCRSSHTGAHPPSPNRPRPRCFEAL